MENQADSNTAKKNEGKGALLALILLLLLTGGGAGYLFWQNGVLNESLEACQEDSAEISEERDRVVVELNDMLVQYDTLSAQNNHLSEDLLAERQKVEKLLKQAKNKNWTIAKLRKETETLRTIMKGYVHTIDSLNTLNINLREENTEVKQELTQQKGKYIQLEKEKEGLSEKVKIGSRLQTSDFIALAQRVKKNGVHRETSRAHKVNKIKCCFTIMKNEIAKPGKRNVFMRVVTPQGRVIAENNTDDFKFEFNGVRGLFSRKKLIEYKNQEQEECIYLDIKSEIPPGEYIVEVYADGADIGKTSFTLK